MAYNPATRTVTFGKFSCSIDELLEVQMALWKALKELHKAQRAPLLSNLPEKILKYVGAHPGGTVTSIGKCGGFKISPALVYPIIKSMLHKGKLQASGKKIYLPGVQISLVEKPLFSLEHVRSKIKYYFEVGIADNEGEGLRLGFLLEMYHKEKKTKIPTEIIDKEILFYLTTLKEADEIIPSTFEGQAHIKKGPKFPTSAS